MYEPPPGTKKEREREDDEPEYKFEWQRKFNAPREEYVHFIKYFDRKDKFGINCTGCAACLFVQFFCLIEN